jgi:hypothetical protein
VISALLLLAQSTARAFWSLLAAPRRLVDARDLYSHDYTRRSMGN